MVGGWPAAAWLALLALMVLGIACGKLWFSRRTRVAALEDEIQKLQNLCRQHEQTLADTCLELRAPLYGMVGLAEALLNAEAAGFSEEGRAHLAMIAGTGHRLGDLVSEVVDTSQVKEGRLVLDRRSTDLRICIEMVLTLSRPLAERKGLALISVVPRDLPPAHADRERLLQILQNLVSSAIESTQEGLIEVSAKVEHGDLMVIVSTPSSASTPSPDSQPSSQNRRLDPWPTPSKPFDRDPDSGRTGRPSTQDPAKGPPVDGEPALTSPGSFIHQLVTLHDGWVWSESGPPGRQYLVLTLPTSNENPVPFHHSEVLSRLRSGSSGPPGLAPPSQRSATEDSPTGQMLPTDLGDPDTILVIDDDPGVRNILCSQLEASGLNAVQAADGQTALDLLAEHSFDLVILDVRMPGMSGYDTCRAIRRQEALEDLPIIFLTGLGRAEDLIAGFAVGANDYLVKPVSHGDLLARVKIHLTSVSAISYRRRLRLAVQTYQEERELRRQLFEARERERRRLAQELHDGPIQDLHALALRLKGADGQTAETTDLKAVTAELRSICTELRPPALMVGGLASSIRAHVARILEREPDRTIALDLMDDRQQLTEGTRLHLFRICQEALANAVQHSKSERIELRFELDAEGCSLEIRDHGCGFKVPRRWVDLARRERFGLVGMVERTEAIGGNFNIRSSPGEGTEIKIDISHAALEVMAPEKSPAAGLEN